EQLARVSLGFDRDRTTVITLSAPTVPATERNAFYHRIVHALAEVPGVAHVGGTLNPPLIGTLHGDIVLTRAGVAPPPGAAVVAQGADITQIRRAHPLPVAPALSPAPRGRAPPVPATAPIPSSTPLARAPAGRRGAAPVGAPPTPPLIGTLHGDIVLTRAGVAPPPGAAVVAQGADIT